MKTKYFQIGDMSFTSKTDKQVAQILYNYNTNKRDSRIRIWLGDTKTGKSWDEENAVTGYVGKSTGSVKIPLLIAKRTSYGGGAILEECIIKIVDIKTKTVLYQHKKFHQKTFDAHNFCDVKEYKACVIQDRKTVYARCKTLESAKRLAGFMNGTRFSK